jgi:predicted DNA-binding transcriptional regulator AlpA
MINELSLRNPDDVLDKALLAEILGITGRSVNRRVARRELPPAFRLGQKSCWRVGTILEFLKARAEAAMTPALKAECEIQTAEWN